MVGPATGDPDQGHWSRCGSAQRPSAKQTCAKPRETQAAEVRLCPALGWQSRSPPAPSAHAVADVGHNAVRCLTWSEAVLSCVPNGVRTRAAALKGRCPRPLDDGDLSSTSNHSVTSPRHPSVPDAQQIRPFTAWSSCCAIVSRAPGKGAKLEQKLERWPRGAVG